MRNYILGFIAGAYDLMGNLEKRNATMARGTYGAAMLNGFDRACDSRLMRFITR